MSPQARGRRRRVGEFKGEEIQDKGAVGRWEDEEEESIGDKRQLLLRTSPEMASMSTSTPKFSCHIDVPLHVCLWAHMGVLVWVAGAGACVGVSSCACAVDSSTFMSMECP